MERSRSATNVFEIATLELSVSGYQIFLLLTKIILLQYQSLSDLFYVMAL
jgi:hypothetical protein